MVTHSFRISLNERFEVEIYILKWVKIITAFVYMLQEKERKASEA